MGEVFFITLTRSKEKESMPYTHQPPPEGSIEIQRVRLNETCGCLVRVRFVTTPLKRLAGAVLFHQYLVETGKKKEVVSPWLAAGYLSKNAAKKLKCRFELALKSERQENEWRGVRSLVRADADFPKTAFFDGSDKTLPVSQLPGDSIEIQRVAVSGPVRLVVNAAPLIDSAGEEKGADLYASLSLIEPGALPIRPAWFYIGYAGKKGVAAALDAFKKHMAFTYPAPWMPIEKMIRVDQFITPQELRNVSGGSRHRSSMQMRSDNPVKICLKRVLPQASFGCSCKRRGR